MAIAILAVLQVVATLLPSLGIGEQIGDRSDEAGTLITPAGWAFSIWGPLFAGTWVYAFYQLLPAQRDNRLLHSIGWASAGAFLGNALWALYTQFFGLGLISSLIIIFTLLCLLHVYRTFAAAEQPFTKGELLLVVLPLSALAAWLSAATIVNIAATLDYYGVDAGDAAPLLAAGVILVAGAIAGAAVWRGRGNPFYAAVFLWALAGIYSANAGGEALVLGSVILAGLCVIAAAGLQLAGAVDRRRWFSLAP